MCRLARRRLAQAVLAAACCGSALAGPVAIRERRAVELRLRLAPGAGAASPAEPFELRLEPGRGGSLAFEAAWPDPESTTSIALVAIARPPQPDAAHVVRLQATVELPGGERRQAVRDVPFHESTTALFELAREDDRSLTLIVEALEVRETVFTARPTAGAPVLLNVEVEWQQDGQVSSLESNRLSTFIGEEVSYAFRLGPTGDAEALELRLTPLAIFGDVLQLRAEITGSLPRANGFELLSRSEQWMITRGESSKLDVGAGEPPTGFRFVVTPRF